MEQDVPQLNFKHGGDSDQGVQRGFTLAPVQEANGRLIESAALGDLIPLAKGPPGQEEVGDGFCPLANGPSGSD